MTTESFLKLLVETEHTLARRKNNALARGQWAKAIAVEAQEELCEQLRQVITKDPETPSFVEEVRSEIEKEQQKKKEWH